MKHWNRLPHPWQQWTVVIFLPLFEVSSHCVAGACLHPCNSAFDHISNKRTLLLMWRTIANWLSSLSSAVFIQYCFIASYTPTWNCTLVSRDWEHLPKKLPMYLPFLGDSSKHNCVSCISAIFSIFCLYYCGKHRNSTLFITDKKWRSGKNS